MINQQLNQQQIQIIAAAQAQASAQAAQIQAAQASQAQAVRDRERSENSIMSRALATVQNHAEQREVQSPVRATVMRFRRFGRI
jgi:hypothetical protein